MPVQQIRVPWIPGYDVGVGADLASGSPMNSPVVPDASSVDQASGAKIDLQIQRIHSTEELERALGVDVEASYGCASFGPSMSARFSFAQKSKVQASSLFMTVTVRVDLEFLSIDTPALTDKAVELVENPGLFEARYGNMFVRGIGRGGLFVGVLRIDTGSSTESMDIAAELKGSYGLFSAEAKQTLSTVQEKHKNEIFVRQYWEGGPKDLTIPDPQNPTRLLENAQTFLESFNASSPEEVAKVATPFFVTLAPTTIADGPIPPDPAQVQHAQDVLVFCARKRSALLDDLNMLEYITENPARFTFTEPTAEHIQQVAEAAQKYQADLTLLAECASAAISNRSAAKFPIEYATERGETFPTSAMPLPMPVPIVTETSVEVPDFSACTSLEACTTLGEEKGFTVAFMPVGDPGPFAVTGQDPPKGVEAEKGSKVEISHPPAPVNVGPKVIDLSKVEILRNMVLPDIHQ